MSGKLCPKIILEGTRLTFKTDVAFALNAHPRVVGPRRYRYHSPVVSGEWCAFTNFPWGRGLINFDPGEREWAIETYRAWLRLFELLPYYSWIVDRFHVSTRAWQAAHGREDLDLSWLERGLAALGFRIVLLTRRPETFEAARSRRIEVSGNPSQYDDLAPFIAEQEVLRRLVAGSILPHVEIDVSDLGVDAVADRIADWLAATGGLEAPAGLGPEAKEPPGARRLHGTVPAKRRAGVLAHPTSLPGAYGIGDLGDPALRFLDWLEAAGQRVWQVLPLGPTSHGDSPYGCLSAFAGNPLLISLERLVEDGLLERADLAGVPRFADDAVDFGLLPGWKGGVLRRAWERFRTAGDDARREFEAFVRAPEQAYWLDDWTTYSALKGRFGGREFTAWPAGLRRGERRALDAARVELAAERELHAFLQMLFFRQWAALAAEARSRGIRVLGDVPIYVAPDSCDVWSHPEYFDLDDAGRPRVVAGVPPDYFSDVGQLWGNPLYLWDRLAEDGYRWWVARVRANLRVADFLRLDHFRGFVSYWEVPAGSETAVEGRWRPGPGAALFEALRREIGGLPFVAEDLGIITDDVRTLKESLGLPGMKVLQFGFDEEDSIHAPENLTSADVAYTGTHDNDTTRGWFEALDDDARARVLSRVGGDAGDAVAALLAAAYASPAHLVVVPLQDALGLGSDARMNTPGVARGNWSWRVRPEQLSGDAALRLRALSRRTGRLG